MGIYSFIFGCIGIGILLWILTGVLSEISFISQTIISQIGQAGTILFVIGLVSLAVVFLISVFSGRPSILSH